MYFLKPISEADAVPEGYKTVHPGLGESVLLPGELYNGLNPIESGVGNLHQQNIEEDEAISMDHEHLAAPQLSVQDIHHERVMDKKGFKQINDSVSSNRTTEMVNERLDNYNIESDRPSDLIVRTHGETHRFEQEVDRLISGNPLAEDVLYVNPKQYHRTLKQRVARQRSKENELLLCSENEEGLGETDYGHSLRRLRPRGESFLTADELVRQGQEHAGTSRRIRASKSTSKNKVGNYG